MAEPVYEDADPMGEYLRESGEGEVFMPGGPSILADPPRSTHTPPFIHFLSTFPFLHPRRTPPTPHTRTRTAFAEHFKYEVISSSLLSSSLTPAPRHTHTQPAPPAPLPRARVPGTLDESDADTDTELSHPPPRSLPDKHTSGAVALISLGAGASYRHSYYLFSLLLVVVLLVLVAAAVNVWGMDCASSQAEVDVEVEDEEDVVIRPTLEALSDLISAGSHWDTVVYDALTLIEEDELKLSPHLPPKKAHHLSLRTSLLTSFHTTTTHTNTVRALLGALTLPRECAQLAEMYAPASPARAGYGLRSPPPSLSIAPGWAAGRRPISYPGSGPCSPGLGFYPPGTGRRRLSVSSPFPSASSSPPTSTFTSTSPPTTASPTSASTGKRATWGGSSYSALAGLMSPAKRRRRGEGVEGSNYSTPITPLLVGVAEEALECGPQPGLPPQEEDEEEAGDGGGEDRKGDFGTEALSLRRRRREGGLGTFGISVSPTQPPPRLHHHPRSYSHSHSQPSTPLRLRPAPIQIHTPTPSPKGSKFTSLQLHTPTHRLHHHHPHPQHQNQQQQHPLSLSAVRHALQSALAAKRYACSYLLALRFEPEAEGEGEDAGGGEGEGREREGDREKEREGYWEDVRSVMGLLTGTLADAAARLGEALDDVNMGREEEGEGDVVDEEGEGEEVGVEESPAPSRADRNGNKRSKSIAQMIMTTVPTAPSFAPMPSHLARFAVHVDAISSAMNDARDDLEACVASLRTEEGARGSAVAVSAYERLRRELGLALRECERGRARLLDLVADSDPGPAELGEDTDDEDELPGLGPDVGSDESDKHDSTPLLDFDRVMAAAREHVGEEREDSHPSGDGEILADDATAHLLRMASSLHLPPQGIEQVFEAEPEPVVAFTRERSKMTRVERIALAKARRDRDSGLGFSSSDEGSLPAGVAVRPGLETWGPGGDVVQELKDVIWQVGERRRKLAEGLGL